MLKNTVYFKSEALWMFFFFYLDESSSSILLSFKMAASISNPVFACRQQANGSAAKK